MDKMEFTEAEYKQISSPNISNTKTPLLKRGANGADGESGYE